MKAELLTYLKLVIYQITVLKEIEFSGKMYNKGEKK